MDGLRMTDEAVRDRVRTATEFLSPGNDPVRPFSAFRILLTPFPFFADDSHARRFGGGSLRHSPDRMLKRLPPVTMPR